MDEYDLNKGDELSTIQLYLKSLENKFADEIIDEEQELELDNSQEAIDCLMVQNGIYSNSKQSNTTQPIVIVATNNENDENSNVTSPNIVFAVSEPDSKFYKIPVSKKGHVDNVDESYQSVTVMPPGVSAEQLNYVFFLSNEGTKDSGNENRIFPEPEITLIKNTSSKCMPVTTVLNEGKSNTNKPLIQFTCVKCKYTTTKKYLLERHKKTHSDDRPFECEICHRGFKAIHALRNHVNIHTNTRPFPCTNCESTFTTSGELVRHTRYKHTHEKPHKCLECDYASVELSKLKRHMRCHTGERPYCCPYCTYASPDTYKLKRHIRTHTGEKPYVCSICNSAFSQSNTLKAHYIVHSSNKPSYRCVYCPAACTRKTDLKNHVQKLHSIGQMLKCRKCKRIFNTRYNFKVHRKVCDGKKCFNCEYCSFSTISQQHLDTHNFMHIDHVQYQCPSCDEIFDDKKELELHNILKHDIDHISSKVKNVICPDCGKAFRFPGNAVRHSAIHNPESSYSEKDEALRIGQRKEPGELRDGEEDDFSDDEVYKLRPTDISASPLSVKNKSPSITETWVMIGNDDDCNEEISMSVVTNDDDKLLGISEDDIKKENDELDNSESSIHKDQTGCDTYNLSVKKTKSTIIHLFSSRQQFQVGDSL